jgi:hypothetical protein
MQATKPNDPNNPAQARATFHSLLAKRPTWASASRFPEQQQGTVRPYATFYSSESQIKTVNIATSHIDTVMDSQYSYFPYRDCHGFHTRCHGFHTRWHIATSHIETVMDSIEGGMIYSSESQKICWERYRCFIFLSHWCIYSHFCRTGVSTHRHRRSIYIHTYKYLYIHTHRYPPARI